MRQYREDFAKEKAHLTACCVANGFEITFLNPGHPVYQLAKITGPDFCIIAYPHKTSAGNRHIRLRQQGSKNVARAYEVIAALDVEAGYNCTFQTKHSSSRTPRKYTPCA
jgi:hypothetical protein